MEYVKGAMFGNRSKGTTASKIINSWGRKLQADWLIESAYSMITEDELDSQGNPIQKPTLLNVHKVRSIGYLKELIAWNPDDNFDRVSAMGMLMILRADRAKFERNKYEEKVKTRLDDPWFTRFAPMYKRVKPTNPAKSQASLGYTEAKN